ncbi:MAG TPA: hypothetical protein VNN55_03045 [bacterium]|nr:hypothetical protein [bacterium]
MALSAASGSLTVPTVTGNQTITGVGFQPKVVLFLAIPATADGSVATAAQGFGVGVSSTNRRSSAAASRDNVASSDTAAGIDNSKCIYLMDYAATILCAADLVSMDSDGFTLNWTTANGTQYVVLYLALGGTDLTNVTTGQFTERTATGNQSVTGVGFAPDCLMLFAYRGTGTAPPSNSAAGDVRFRLGVGTAAGQWQLNGQSRNGQVAAITNRYQRTNSIYSRINDAADSVAKEASLVSLDSDGFTLNYSVADTAAYYIFYVALKGASVGVTSFNQPTATGNQSISGFGFTPKAVLLASFNAAAATTVQVHNRYSLGIGTSSSARGAIWSGDTDAADPMICDSFLDRTKIIKLATEGTPTVDAEADLVSLDADGFTLNWTTVDATARQILAFAIGQPADGGGGGGGESVGVSPYRLRHDLSGASRAGARGLAC